MTKRILLLVPHLDLGGGARRIKTYCDYLDRTQFKPVVCVYSKNVLRDLSKITGNKTPVLVSNDISKIQKFIDLQKIDVIYTFYDGQFHAFLFDLLQYAKNKNIKIVGNNVFAYYDSKMDGLFDLVLFQTKMMLEIKFKKNLPQGKKIDYTKYRVLYNPVHSTYFHKFALSSEEKKELRTKLNISENDFVVGRFGRSDIVKWGDILFWTILKMLRYPNIKFLIVGMPRSRRIILYELAKINSEIKDKIIILEPTNDDQKLMGLMQICNVVGHGVRIGEGCSNAINEAMYWSKPVITNSTPFCDNGQVEQVDHLLTGIIANSSTDFVKAILKLKHGPNLVGKLGENGHKKVMRYYESRLVVKEFENQINTLFGGSAKRTSITVTRPQLRKFAKWYTKNINGLFLDDRQTFNSRIIFFPIRILNFLEYKYFNG